MELIWPLVFVGFSGNADEAEAEIAARRRRKRMTPPLMDEPMWRERKRKRYKTRCQALEVFLYLGERWR